MLNSTHRKRFGKFLKLLLQRHDMSLINMSIPNYMDELTRSEACKGKLTLKKKKKKKIITRFHK